MSTPDKLPLSEMRRIICSRVAGCVAAVKWRGSMKIDVIIPVYKPGKELFELIDRLEKQTVPVNRIILMNTEEKYLEQLVYGSVFF